MIELAILEKMFLHAVYIAMSIPERGSSKVLSNLDISHWLRIAKVCLEQENIELMRKKYPLGHPNFRASFDENIIWLKTLKSDLELEIKQKSLQKMINGSAKRIAQKHATRRNNKKGYIYLVQALMPETYYKIGLSKRPVKRIKSMGVKLPFPIKTLHTFPTDNVHRAEKILHNRYDSLRVNGEWFELSNQDVADICAIREMNFEVQS